MIKKIISGGQTGADRAALDTALELGIAHGGWVPKGRKTEKGRLPEKYRLKETNAIDYEQRTELNIIDSDATLLFSHGPLKGGSALTRNLAQKHRKPCFYIDLDLINSYKAVEIIRTWIETREIEILNVAGSRESEDPLIYDSVQEVLRSLLYPPPERILNHIPETIMDAVDDLISMIPRKRQIAFARMKEKDFIRSFSGIDRHIANRVMLWSRDERLLEDCRLILKNDGLDERDMNLVIIRELWKKLKDTHELKIIK